MSTMTVEKWYGESLPIPSKKDGSFKNFVTSAMGIVSTIVRRQLDKNIQIRFVREGTAAADPENQVIYVNENYLEGAVPFRRSTLNSTEIITLLLGLFVHEAAHFAYSYKDLTNYTQHIRNKTPFPFNESIAASVGNIVEDVFIEAEIDRRVPSLFWMLERTNEMFFSDKDLKRKLTDASSIEVAPRLMQDVVNVLDVLIYAKTRDSVDTTPYISGLFELARSAILPYSLKEREDIALDIYNQLMERCEAEECKYKDSLAKKAEESSRAFGAEQLDDMPSRLTNKTASRINNALEELKNCIVTREESTEEDKEGEISIFIEEIVKPDTNSVTADVRYARLAELGRQQATTNRPYGLDSVRGSHIRKLHRIATDAKIFAERVVMKDYKPMQVAILMDCSGSMREIVSGKGGHATTRLQQTAQATLGAALALLEARCDVAVYGHTADLRGMDDTHIYTIKTFQESSALLAEKIYAVLEERAHVNNRDGYAVNYVGGKFTKPNCRRLLIVISDGQPAAANYGGHSGIEHTRQQVNELRRKGIEVLSISISREAREPNDMIYGHLWNVSNQDVNVIEQIIQKLVLS